MGVPDHSDNPQRDELGTKIMAAAELFCNSQNVSLTCKRLLYEFLAMPGPNGKTLSGLCKPGVQAQHGAKADVVYITRSFIGFHIIKHYYVMRQYNEASGVVRDFLQFLHKEGSLPGSFTAELDEAIEVAKEGCEQLPHIMRILRQPDVLNEAYSFRYPLRPWPLCQVPQSTEVKESSSRCWPADNQQHHDAWISFASERCRVEPEELEKLLEQVPKHLSVSNVTEGTWEVKAVQPDSSIVFREWQGSQEFVVPFSPKRAADFMPGMVMCATFVTLSTGRSFVTDWGYTFPSFYGPYLTSKADFGPYDPVELVH